MEKTREEKAQNVLEYYALNNSLKDVERTGWNDWKVKRNRIESIGEHVFGVQQLAIAMWSEFGYDIDINKVIMMLASHELEETIIGDLTQFQISKAEKAKLGHDADERVLKNLKRGEYIKSLVFEFDERKTPEALFAYMCDKLECDIQCKLYDEEECVNLNNQNGNNTAEDKRVKDLLESGKTWSGMWMQFGRDNYPYDENFRLVSEYAEKINLHNARKLIKERK